jgi:hypothetical protein
LREDLDEQVLETRHLSSISRYHGSIWKNIETNPALC